jgi:hypothetical protein
MTLSGATSIGEPVARIDATDRLIDGLVYELYGLSEEEIGIVEGAAARDEGRMTPSGDE